MKFLVLLMVVCLAGCHHGKRYSALAGAGAIGGGAGYLAFKKSPLAAGVGAIAGTLAASCILGEDEEALACGYQEGYCQASSNAIKRQYWLRQSLGVQSMPTTTYYTLPGNTLTEDGRLLVDHTVTIPIVE